AARGGEAVRADVLLMAGELRDDGRRAGVRPETIGVGVAELVDRCGDVVSGGTIAWQGLAVRERVSTVLPTVIEVDVRAAALAEARLGAGRAFSSFVFVTIGTGISSCLVIDGLPVPGCRGLAGTLASGPTLAVTPGGELLSGLPLECYASGPALVARLNRHRPGLVRTGLDVAELAAAGDATALHVVHSAGRATGAAVAHLVDVLDPGAVVIGGGLGLAGGAYWEALEATIHERVWSELHRNVPVIAARLGIDAGWMGAAFTASERAWRAHV
ncbi:MAG: ROK family protein, partial [Vicinamibacteraceae bacterium]